MQEEGSDKMIPKNLLPTPRHVEERIGSLVRIVATETTNDLGRVLKPEDRIKFAHLIDSEQFRREGYVLATQQTKDGAKIYVYSQIPVGLYYGKNTAERLLKLNNGVIPELIIVDYPAFPIRGVSEGFYGVPWTWEQRKDIIEETSKVGYNTFVFAPPDINRKVNWREPLPESYKIRLEELIKHAHQHHVSFVYEILPIFIDLASRQDYKKLLERCKEAIELGSDAIMVAFDDTNDYEGRHVKREKAALGQATLLNNLRQDIGSDKTFLCLVPVEYYGVKETPYLKTIGRELDEAIYIGWVGPKIRSARVTKEDALGYGEIVGRKPFLGHNFPVVDEMKKKRRLTIGPLMGLDAQLTEVLSGIAFNFMELPYASLVSGFTAGDFAWNPSEYYPSRSIRNSTRIHGENLMRLVDLNPESFVNVDGVPDIARILRQFKFKDLPLRQRQELRDIFDTMVNLDDLISEGVDPRIYAEIRPWLTQSNMIGALGNLILDEKIKDINWKAKSYAALKMISGYRLSGLVFEDWILREMGFPANLFCHIPALRLVADFFETVARKRHKRQKV